MYIVYVTYTAGYGVVIRMNVPNEFQNWRCSESDWMVPGTVDHN